MMKPPKLETPWIKIIFLSITLVLLIIFSIGCKKHAPAGKTLCSYAKLYPIDNNKDSVVFIGKFSSQQGFKFADTTIIYPVSMRLGHRFYNSCGELVEPEITYISVYTTVNRKHVKLYADMLFNGKTLKKDYNISIHKKDSLTLIDHKGNKYEI